MCHTLKIIKETMLFVFFSLILDRLIHDCNAFQ